MLATAIVWVGAHVLDKFKLLELFKAAVINIMQLEISSYWPVCKQNPLKKKLKRKQTATKKTDGKTLYIHFLHILQSWNCIKAAFQCTNKSVPTYPLSSFWLFNNTKRNNTTCTKNIVLPIKALSQVGCWNTI